MGDEGTTDRGFRAAAEVAVGAQQSAEDGPPAFCLQTVGEDHGQQHSRKFLAEVIDVDVWARGAQPQDERHIRRLSGGQHQRMADLIPQLDSDGGIHVETDAPLVLGAFGDVALGLDAGQAVGCRIVVHTLQTRLGHAVSVQQIVENRVVQG